MKKINTMLCATLALSACDWKSEGNGLDPENFDSTGETGDGEDFGDTDTAGDTSGGDESSDSDCGSACVGWPEAPEVGVNALDFYSLTPQDAWISSTYTESNHSCADPVSGEGFSVFTQDFDVLDLKGTRVFDGVVETWTSAGGSQEMAPGVRVIDNILGLLIFVPPMPMEAVLSKGEAAYEGLIYVYDEDDEKLEEALGAVLAAFETSNLGFAASQPPGPPQEPRGIGCSVACSVGGAACGGAASGGIASLCAGSGAAALPWLGPGVVLAAAECLALAKFGGVAAGAVCTSACLGAWSP